METQQGETRTGAIQTIVVVGGGSAGWIAAARLAARHARGTDDIVVKLVESSTVPPIGVGEPSPLYVFFVSLHEFNMEMILHLSG